MLCSLRSVVVSCGRLRSVAVGCGRLRSVAVSGECCVVQHGLLDTEAQAVRTSILSTLPHIRAFGDSILATKRKLGRVIEQIEGSPPGEAETDVAETQVRGGGTLNLNTYKFFFTLSQNLRLSHGDSSHFIWNALLRVLR